MKVKNIMTSIEFKKIENSFGIKKCSPSILNKNNFIFARNGVGKTSLFDIFKNINTNSLINICDVKDDNKTTEFHINVMFEGKKYEIKNNKESVDEFLTENSVLLFNYNDYKEIDDSTINLFIDLDKYTELKNEINKMIEENFKGLSLNIELINYIQKNKLFLDKIIEINGLSLDNKLFKDRLKAVNKASIQKFRINNYSDLKKLGYSLNDKSLKEATEYNDHIKNRDQMINFNSLFEKFEKLNENNQWQMLIQNRENPNYRFESSDEIKNNIEKINKKIPKIDSEIILEFQKLIDKNPTSKEKIMEIMKKDDKFFLLMIMDDLELKMLSLLVQNNILFNYLINNKIKFMEELNILLEKIEKIREKNNIIGFQKEKLNFYIDDFNLYFDNMFKVSWNEDDSSEADPYTLQKVEKIDIQINGLNVADENQFSRISQSQKIIYYFFNFYCKIKTNNKQAIIIFDDTIEAFDTRYRYSFSKFIIDISSDKKNIIIFLSHNVEVLKFWKLKSTNSRSYEMKKNDNGLLTFVQGDIKTFGGLVGSEMNIIVSVVVMRNFFNIINIDKSNMLTKFLHIKNIEEFMNFKVGDINKIYSDYKYTNLTGINEKINEEKYFDYLISESERIINKKNRLEFEEKIIISIAIRIIFELYYIEKYNHHMLNNPPKNQTQEFYEKCNEEDKIFFIDVILFIPDIIHLNGFSYQAIADTDIEHLKYIYKSYRDECKVMSRYVK